MEKPIRFMNAKQIAERTGLHNSTIRKMAVRGDFPKGIQIRNTKNVRWLESEVDAWCKEQLERRSL